jgi:L-ascorbate 6-phosphate lactonase
VTDGEVREVVGIGLIGRVDALGVGRRSLAFWGLGQVGGGDQGPNWRSLHRPLPYRLGRRRRHTTTHLPPPVSPSEVTNASAVLLTHAHIDHTDPDTILPLSEASPTAATSSATSMP